jgi:hypothetical protein
MRISLDPDEIRILTQVIQSAQSERSRNIADARSSEERARLEGEVRLLEEIRARLAVAHREDVIDESVEETFPASDPPARSAVRERGAPGDRRV